MDESTTHSEVLDKVLIEAGAAEAEAQEIAAEEAVEEEVEELSAKEKKKLINVENLSRKFKAQVQGNQKKISTWEDRTVAKLKQMGFVTMGFGDDGKWRLKMGTLVACISSNHGPRSSTGFLKFTDSAVVEEAK